MNFFNNKIFIMLISLGIVIAIPQVAAAKNPPDQAPTQVDEKAEVPVEESAKDSKNISWWNKLSPDHKTKAKAGVALATVVVTLVIAFLYLQPGKKPKTPTKPEKKTSTTHPDSQAKSNPRNKGAASMGGTGAASPHTTKPVLTEEEEEKALREALNKTRAPIPLPPPVPEEPKIESKKTDDDWSDTDEPEPDGIKNLTQEERQEIFKKLFEGGGSVVRQVYVTNPTVKTKLRANKYHTLSHTEALQAMLAARKKDIGADPEGAFGKAGKVTPIVNTNKSGYVNPTPAVVVDPLAPIPAAVAAPVLPAAAPPPPVVMNAFLERANKMRAHIEPSDDDDEEEEPMSPMSDID